MEMAISKEVYEAVKAQVLRELEEKKREKRRIDLAVEEVFAPAHRKYYDKILDKFGRGPGGYGRKESIDVYFEATKTALAMLGFKSAREAYINGYAEEANQNAEKILEAMLQDYKEKKA